ncbi:hypothetical protein EV426DRAFT_107017 [Tirmania nivea]|nr:hypothetical protein EV426DRAFT_107017 [Tirmania nivea]
MEFHWSDVQKLLRRPALLGILRNLLPTVIKSISRGTTWTTPHIQALTIPGYLLGYLLTARFSHVPIALPRLHCLHSGYTPPHPLRPTGAHYLALIAAGLYVAVGLPLSWSPSSSPRYRKRTSGSRFQLNIGNIAGVMTPYCKACSDARAGGVWEAQCMRWWSYVRTNRRREEGSEDWKVEGKEENWVRELGDEA